MSLSFLCFQSKATFENQVQKGGETILNSAVDKKNGGVVRGNMSNKTARGTKNNGMNENLERYLKS